MDVKTVDTISFTVNGKLYTVGNEYPVHTSLLEFLRKSGASTGTKGCCFEGGCGICLVTITFMDPVIKEAKTCSVNSCCLPLYSCYGLAITTVEGLGNAISGFHDIQLRLATFNGVQCGYCSPGQVMNMYGLLKNKPRPLMKDVEDVFDTTICRCTGYRPILDAMKSFAVDAPESLGGGVIDIEELDGKICCKSKRQCKEIFKNKDMPLQIVSGVREWFRPADLNQLTFLLLMYMKTEYRLVFGNTGFGIFKDLAVVNYQTLIDIRGVKEMYGVDHDEPFSIHIGANLTLTNLKEVFESINDPNVPYSKDFATHLNYVTSYGVRNLGSWAGNLMLKHQHKEFPSDVFTVLETVGATLNIVNERGRNKNYSLLEFLSLDMNGKVIVSMQLPKYSSNDIIIRTFKTAPRLQLSIPHVCSGFNFQIDVGKDYMIKKRPTIIVQGISSTLVHASNTEEFLTNKKLSDPAVVKDAIRALSKDLQVNSEEPSVVSLSYRISVATGHFYKFILGVCKDKCDIRYVSGGLDLERALMSATHDYGTQNPDIDPVSKPLTKLTAQNLATGEVKFINDLPFLQGQLFAAVLLSPLGNAAIDKIDPTKAMVMPGVVQFLTAKDIPGQNNWRPVSIYGQFTSEVLCEKTVEYAGQPIGIIVAECENIAKEAVKAVEVTYTDIKAVIVDVMDAIQQKSFLTKLGPYTKGTAEAALETAPNRVKGNSSTHAQYHFHMENQAAMCIPTDLGGMEVFTTTQWIDATQETVAQVLRITEASVTVETQRLGGAFGGKILYNLPVAAMAAIAAYRTSRPVKMSMDLETNMQFQGDRMSYYFEYEIGFDNDGKLLAIVATAYGDGGFINQPELDEHTYNYVDSAYYCPNWSWSVQVCKTHKPVITYMRAPGSATAMFAMESMLDHVATYLKIDHLEVRKINLFSNGQTTLSALVVEHCLAQEVVKQLETDINYQDRKKQVEDFNKANRWRKRGLQVMPGRYSMMYTKLKHSTSVIVFHGDATVIISHGGIDIGQGINTKAVQVCAYKLGIPIDKIRVIKSTSYMNANSDFTGGSTISELICNGVIKCCEELNKRMAKSRESLISPTWEEVVTKAYADGVNLTSQYWPDILQDHYSCYTACCSEVELDILTGQYQIRQVDYVYDCGISLNPELDLGQLEGAFVMGCGMFLLESMRWDPKSGKALTDGTNTYKLPLAKDIPINLNVKFLRNAPNPVGVLGSKAVGETPVVIGACPLFALKRAVEAARAEIGAIGWFPFRLTIFMSCPIHVSCKVLWRAAVFSPESDAPATVEKIQQACLNDTSKYTLESEPGVQASTFCQAS